MGAVELFILQSGYQKRIVCCKGILAIAGRADSAAFLVITSEVILMGHPVTTNPFIIMLINMTVVFVVLYGLSLLIRLIHIIDPTKKKG
jgi:hypothetical protein